MTSCDMIQVKTESWSKHKDKKQRRQKRREIKEFRRKRKQEVDESDLDELAEDARLVKKLRKGKVRICLTRVCVCVMEHPLYPQMKVTAVEISLSTQ